ncbi:GntR family transcriptional regulator [Salinarimonas chemoclinalis]|uniref:GntR family transcriptional regulator n=1 Tax=Salinarimonas chemoclinalis TaxID=3241599 RepID=UPI0035589B88
MPPSRSETAYRSLRAAIGDLRWPPGARLPLPVLAEELAMSPVPIREALSRLAAEGIVTHRRNGGFFVGEVRLDALEDDYVTIACVAWLTLVHLADGALGAEGARAVAEPGRPPPGSLRGLDALMAHAPSRGIARAGAASLERSRTCRRIDVRARSFAERRALVARMRALRACVADRDGARVEALVAEELRIGLARIEGAYKEILFALSASR